MSKHERLARIDGIDLTTGIFPMTLATEGEASDGNILSIKGGQIPERMPMLASHWNDPSAALGSITDPVKLLKDSPPRLRAMGHIEMTGEGAPAEIRRDLAHMIDKGHVTAVSIRWDDVPGKAIRRVNLPSDHPYFVNAESEEDPRKRYGIYFEEWHALEGSIVALGADPQALIGRAEETNGEVRAFWRAMADDAELNELERRAWNEPIETSENQRPDPGQYSDKDAYMKDCVPMVMAEGKNQDEAVAQCNSIWENREEPRDESSSAKIAASLAGLRIDAAGCLEAGASHADCINAVVDGTDAKIESVDLGEHVVFLPKSIATELREKLEPKSELEREVSVSSEEMKCLLERLEALEEYIAKNDEPAALEEGRESDDPPPSSKPERVKEGDPLQPAIANPNEFIDSLITGLKEAHKRVHSPKTDDIVRPHELAETLSQWLAEARERTERKLTAAIKKARGEVST